MTDDINSRLKMPAIAKQHNLFVTKSTIHRWANEPGFPYPVGQDVLNLLYARGRVCGVPEAEAAKD